MTEPELKLILGSYLSGVRAKEVAALNAAIAQATVLEACGLPADGAAVITELKRDLNAKLAAMPPLDMVKCAHDVNSAIEWMSHAFERCNDLVGSAMERLTKVTESLKGLKPAGELNSLAEATIAERLTRGELLTKQAADDLVTGAVAAAKRDALATFELCAARKESLTAFGLTAPEAAVLGLPQAEWDPVLEAAKGAAKQLTSLGLDATAQELCGLPWLPAAQRDERLKFIALGAKQKASSGTDPMLLPEKKPAAPAGVPGDVAGCC